MSTEKSFKITVPDEKLANLRAKLELATFPDELDDAGWAYGTPLADVKRLVARWKEGYEWREHERKLNEELPQFTRDIGVDGFGTLNVHYVHKKSEVVDAIPLLFVHGWPGSFIEVRKILPLLVTNAPGHPSFHVVALSLPGYGFSQGSRKRGFKASQYAEVCNKLMIALGYSEYVTQGGDWGFIVTRKIANLYGGRHSKAWHSNMPFASPPHPIRTPFAFLQFLVTPLSAAEKAGLARTMRHKDTGMGYMAEQSTCPQTLGYSLADSPVGLLAWIYEKLVSWTDEYPWDDDEVLTWISIYLFSRDGPAASLRIYAELIQDEFMQPNYDVPSIPMGISYFPQELVNLPRRWLRRSGNVVLESEQDSGGHFAAHEKPQELVSDLRKMFGKDGGAFAVVGGRAGYEKL